MIINIWPHMTPDDLMRPQSLWSYFHEWFKVGSLSLLYNAAKISFKRSPNRAPCGIRLRYPAIYRLCPISWRRSWYPDYSGLWLRVKFFLFNLKKLIFKKIRLYEFLRIIWNPEIKNWCLHLPPIKTRLTCRNSASVQPENWKILPRKR